MKAICGWWRQTIINSHLTFTKEYSHIMAKKQHSMSQNLSWHTNTHHLLSDRVVCCLEVAEHFSYDLLGIAAIAHSIQQISCPLSNTHIPLSLQTEKQAVTTWNKENVTKVEDLKTSQLCLDCNVLLTNIPQLYTVYFSKLWCVVVKWKCIGGLWRLAGLTA